MIRFTLAAIVLLLLAVAGCSDSPESTPLTPKPDSDPVPTLDAPGLQALAPYSPGDQITLQWTDPAKEGTHEYLAQRSADPGFTDGITSTDWTSSTSVVFADLPEGIEQHFRVMARDADDAISDWSAIVRTTPDASPPQSRLLDLAEEQYSLRFQVAFEAEDSGAGVVETELWVRHEEDREFERIGTFENSPATFVAVKSGRYELRTLARDGVGNAEIKPTVDGWTIVPEPIILTDRNGKEWDITNAALRYGMAAFRWGHGIGQHSIPPVIAPRLLAPNEPGYPEDDERFEVLGVAINGEAHAYRMGDLPNREVVDDVVGNVPVAVAY